MASLPSHGCGVTFRSFFLALRLGDGGPLLHREMLIGATKLWTVLLHFQAVLVEGISPWPEISSFDLND